MEWGQQSEGVEEAAEQACGLGWSLASARSHGELWSVNLTTELVPLWSKGLAFCTSQGLVPDCLACGCELLGYKVVMVPRVLLWERAAESLAAKAHSSWRPARQVRDAARVQRASTAGFQGPLFTLNQRPQSQMSERLGWLMAHQTNMHILRGRIPFQLRPVEALATIQEWVGSWSLSWEQPLGPQVPFDPHHPEVILEKYMCISVSTCVSACTECRCTRDQCVQHTKGWLPGQFKMFTGLYGGSSVLFWLVRCGHVSHCRTQLLVFILLYTLDLQEKTT